MHKSFIEGQRNLSTILALWISDLLIICDIICYVTVLVIYSRYVQILLHHDSLYSGLIILGLTTAGASHILFHLIRLKILLRCNKSSYGDVHKPSGQWKLHMWRILLIGTVLCVFEFGMASSCLIYKRSAHGLLAGGMKDSIKRYRSHIADRKWLNKIQVQFRCCGYLGFDDWFYEPWNEGTFLPRRKIRRLWLVADGGVIVYFSIVYG